MAIQKDAILEISQVGNGFIVRPGGHQWFQQDNRMWAGNQEDYLVFRTMAELQQWLSEHFTHRARPNWPDVMPVQKPKAVAAKPS